MYPYINLWVQFYTFWISITICFFLFIWMLFKMSKRLNYSFDLFKNNILWFFISTLFFWRIFYIISNWHEQRHIKDFKDFFVMTDYNFSLMWCLAWFFLVLLILVKLRKEKIDNYIYWVVLSLFFVFPVWFFWALLWWQVYWLDTNFWFEISYTNKYTTIPYTSPIFPLAIFYSIIFFIAFCLLYISQMYVKEKNILWYAWILVFSCVIFMMEFFNWKPVDLFKENIWLNLSQVCAVIIFWVVGYYVFKLYKKETRRWR